MTSVGLLPTIAEPLAALASVVPGIKAWRANDKAEDVAGALAEIKGLFVQRQSQKQTQQVTVNIGQTASSTAKTPDEEVTLSGEEPEL